MASFSIDEVRDSFSTDMTQFLNQIESATAELLRLQESFRSMPLDENGRALFEAVAAHSHAIVGTSSLVGAESLVQCSRLLERITRQGQIAVLRAQAQLVRAHQVADLCNQGAQSMRQMLEFELSHKSSEALELSRVWQQKVAQIEPIADLRTRDLHVLGEPENMKRQFSFEEKATRDSPASATAPSASQYLDQELRAVFQQEAQESLVALQANFQALLEKPEEIAAAEQIERIFHTLKGASATVGLTDLSSQAADLRARMEQLLDSGTISTAKIFEVLDETNKLMQLAGLPKIVLLASQNQSSTPPSSSEKSSSESFSDEAMDICSQSIALVQELDFADADRISQIYSSLTKLLRRLSGSALVEGENAVADSAAELEAACEKKEPTDIIRNQLRQVIILLGFDHLLSAKTPNDFTTIRENVQVESDPELWDAFHQECSDLLEAIQKETLSLEESGQPKEVLESLMRQHHTLKGAANSVGLVPTARLLHRIEDFLEGLLNVPILPSMREVVDLLLDVQKEISSHLRTASEGFVEHGLGHFKTRIAQVLAARRLSGSTVSSTPSLPSFDKSSSQNATGSSVGEQVSSMEITDKRTIRVLAERLDSLMNLAGELVVSRSRLSSRVGLLRTMQEELGLAQRRLLECVEGFRSTYEFANLDGKSSTSLGTEKPTPVSRRAEWSKFSDLELDRYDDIHVLSRSIGEISADLDEIAGNLFQEMAGLADDADSFGSIVSGIQNEVTRARMVPVEKLFSRLLLPVRDASALEHKEAHIVTAGEEVNLDKTIADALFQPMLHLVRNAVVHGIESPSAREASGKTRYGNITLGARQESGQIVLEIRDDGRGLDLAALHSRGVSLGHIPPETPLNDPSVKNLVFMRSLSTAASLKMVSGRGLGCDVVRRAVERLNGSIRVDTTGGQGTVFTIILPLTLAITRALMVQHASRVYAIPLFFAEHIFDLEQAQVVESAGSVRMKIDEHFMPVHPISSVLSSSNKTSDRGPVIVLRMGEQRLAVQVDSVLAQEEIVVKGLGEILQGHPVFAGATIRGNGELALIIDVPGIIETIVGVRSPSLDLMVEPEAAKIDKEPRLSSASHQSAIGTSKKKSPTPSKTAKDAVPVQPHTSDNGPKPPIAVSQPASPTALIAEVTAQEVLVSSTAAAKETRVLFVDDSLSVRKVAEKALLSLGVQVTVAVDGLDALEKLRSQSFDIVFTDLEMPRMHGFEFLRELRFLPAWRSLPVVVVSSRSGQKHQDQARALGANDYLTKPFDAQSLNNAIKRWVSLQTTGNSDSTDSIPEVEK